MKDMLLIPEALVLGGLGWLVCLEMLEYCFQTVQKKYSIGRQSPYNGECIYIDHF